MGMKDHKVPVQSLIDHIKTAIDVDDWAKEITEELLKEHEAVEPKVSSTEQRCGNCNKVIEMDGWIACPWCGKPIAWNEWWNKNGGTRMVDRW